MPVPAGVSAQRRHLTIAFCDLCGSTRIAAGLEPEIYAELLETLRDMTERVAARHGGEVVRIDGDGAVLLFGLAAGQEDPGRRATEAALDLHDAVSTLDRHFTGLSQPVRLHSGIHSGVVLLRPGDVVRGKFEMLGDATNVASRLCEMAGADEIIVSEASLGSDRHFFRTGPRREVELRGTGRCLPAYAVTGRERTETRFAARARQGLTPFAGRRRELAVLRRALDEASSGEARIVMVSGPPGIGKTRLVAEYLDETAQRDVNVHQAYCEAYLGARPLQPLAQLALSLLAGGNGKAAAQDHPLSELDEETAATLHHLLLLVESNGSAGDRERLQPGQIAHALARLLAEYDTPQILWIDDWQWVDDASRAALQLLFASAGRALLVILTTRKADPLFAALTGAEPVELAGLDPAESLAAIEGTGATLPPFMVGQICDEAGGSPLFIEELCHSFQRGDERAEGGGIPGDDRNAWLDGLIQARFSRLPDDLARIVKAASAIGPVFSETLFVAITGCAPGDPCRSALAAHDFIYPGDVPGTLRFKHGLTRDAIYSMIGLAERRELHGRIVDALLAAGSGGDDQLEALGYHYGEGGNAERAAHYAALAGDRALAISALDRAQAQYRSALTALDKLALSAGPEHALAGQRIQILRRFGLACVVDPSREQLPVLQRAVEHAQAEGDTKALAWAEYWLGFILYGLGDARASLDHFRDALSAAGAAGETRLAAQIPANLGQAHATACNYEPALALLGQSIAAMEMIKLSSNALLTYAYSLSCRGFVLADQGQFNAAYADFDAAIGALADAEHEMTASVLTMRSASLLWQGRFAEAALYAERGLAVAERVKARYLFAMARSLAAYAHWAMTGNPAEIETILAATRWLEASASQQFISLNHGWLAEALTAEGRRAEARRHAALALMRARRGDRLGEAMAWRAMAAGAAAEGRRELAARYLTHADRAANVRQSPHEAARNSLMRGHILRQAGQRDAAASWLQQARSAFETLEMDEAMEVAPGQFPIGMDG